MSGKSNKIVKEQHYVWRGYLKRWTKDESTTGRICVYKKKTHCSEIEIGEYSLREVAFEKYFYDIYDSTDCKKLTEQDLNILYQISTSMMNNQYLQIIINEKLCKEEGSRDYIEKLLCQYEDIDNNGHYLEKMLKGQLSFYEDSLLQKEFQKMIEKIKNNERLDTDISVSLYQSIENVVNGKALESKHDFLRYFFVQYLRGPRFIDSQKEYFEIIKKENERDINVNFLSIAMVFRLAEQMAIDVDTYYYS